MELKVPRTRDGVFSPTVFERYQRNEKALLASMLEMYVSGVSTRKVSQIVEELCGKSVSKSFVSSLTAQLDPIVKEWQNRTLAGTKFPYLMVDVLYIKARVEQRVLSQSCHIAVGITEEGDRQIIGFMLQNEESHETWTTFFDYLKNQWINGYETCDFRRAQRSSFCHSDFFYRSFLAEMSGSLYAKHSKYSS